jgi:hypothetical protein
MIQRVAQLRLDEGPLLLDDEQRTLAPGELAQAFGFQRPGQRDLVQRYLGVAVQTEQTQRVQCVLVRLADSHQSDRRVARAEYQPVEAICTCPGQHGRQALVDDAAFQFGAVRRKTQSRIEIQSMRRQCMIWHYELAA